MTKRLSKDTPPIDQPPTPFKITRSKRILDVILILLASPAVLPLSALITVLIKVASPGPVLFRQKRVGYGRNGFTCLKFRTMRVDADTAVHEEHTAQLLTSGKPMIKLDHDDDRVFPLGALLRATGLDELPQVWNVLKGEMSLVGPRPCLPYEFKKYQSWQKRRCDGLPGLTGLWQVEGKNHTNFEEMVQLDLDYLRRQSLWFDLKIILKTIPALFHQYRESRDLRQSAAGEEANNTRDCTCQNQSTSE